MSLWRQVTRGRAGPLSLGLRETRVICLPKADRASSCTQTPAWHHWAPAAGSPPGLSALWGRIMPQQKMMFGVGTTRLYLNHRQTKAAPKKTPWKRDTSMIPLLTRPLSPINLCLVMPSESVTLDERGVFRKLAPAYINGILYMLTPPPGHSEIPRHTTEQRSGAEENAFRRSQQTQCRQNLM